jgi:hypothetical protein
VPLKFLFTPPSERLLAGEVPPLADRQGLDSASNHTSEKTISVILFGNHSNCALGKEKENWRGIL